MPTTLGMALKVVATFIRPWIQMWGSKYWSPKKPLPSNLLQHHPGLLMWLSNIIITLLFARLATTACHTSSMHTEKKKVNYRQIWNLRFHIRLVQLHIPYKMDNLILLKKYFRKFKLREETKYFNYFLTFFLYIWQYFF